MSALSRWRARTLPSVVRVVVFTVFTLGSWWVLASLMAAALDALAASALSLAAAILLTTTVMMRIYEGRPLYMVGLFANRTGVRHLAIGLAWGAGSSLFVVLAQWAGGWARFERTAAGPGELPTLAFGLAVLLVGSAGEELLFRGYGFQHLIRAFGPWVSIVSTSVLFAWAHAENPAYSRLGMANTALFGLVFGYTYWRTLDLWAPLGMHFGWNFSLAAFGATVSGLKIELTGLAVVPTGSVLLSGGAYGPEASLWTTVALAAAMGYMWKGALRRQSLGLLAEREDESRAIGVDQLAGGRRESAAGGGRAQL